MSIVADSDQTRLLILKLFLLFRTNLLKRTFLIYCKSKRSPFATNEGVHGQVVCERTMANESDIEDQNVDQSSNKKTGATWDRPLEFLLNLIGYMVGLGNIWRFPYLCYENGGGAFLIPYLLVGVFCGLPLLFMEISLGQYTRRGSFGSWNLVPLLKGLGITGFVLSWYYLSYIPVVMSWAIFYFLHSFTSGALAWSTCDNHWNTNSCVPAGAIADMHNFTLNITENTTAGSTREFWNNYVLQKTSSIDDIGTLTNWRLIICFLVAWAICYLCVLKGIHTSGKVAYITVIAPYVMLFVLLGRGLTLEGAGAGIYYFINPRPDKLANASVWLDGGAQALYTIGVSFAVLYGLGSFNKFNTDSYKNAFICIGTCYATSLIAGFVVFSYLGHMSVTQGKSITEVATGGPGLLFEILPSALSMLPFPPVWSAVFFAVVILVAIDTVFGTIEGCTRVMEDIRPDWFEKYGSQLCRLGVCLFPFLLGIPMIFDGGVYVFTLVDWYGCNGLVILSAACIESVGLGWIYGVDRFFDDVQEMIGYRPNVFLKYCYLFITPVITLAIFVASCIDLNPRSFPFPPWANAIGWVIFLTTILPIPIMAGKALMQSSGSLTQRWKQATASRLDKIYRCPEK